MAILKNKIDEILNKKGLSRYKLSQSIDITEATLSQMTNGKAKFSENVIKKLLPILEVSKEEFTAWVIADKYSKEAIQAAINELKIKPGDNIPILTKNIDKILADKNISRTELSKLIKYDQSGLNKMIAGQISMSKAVLSKVAKTLNINDDTLQNWILADKYSLNTLIQSLEIF